MLIIKSDPNSLKGVEQFLRNREWHLKSTTQMKDAVMFLVQNKPSFVLVSVDHPNKKMMKLPKILASAFPCCTMVFAEKSGTGSFKALLESGCEYKINPPITGPAIERAVNKYIRDQEQAQKQKESGGPIGGQEKNNFEFSVEIKSSGDKQSNVMNFQSKVKTDGSSAPGVIEGSSNSATNSIAQSLLAQLNSDDDNAGPAVAPGIIQSGSSGPQIMGSGFDSSGNPGTLGGSNSKEAAGSWMPIEGAEGRKAKGTGYQPGESEEDSHGSAPGTLGGRRKNKNGEYESSDDSESGPGYMGGGDSKRRGGDLLINPKDRKKGEGYDGSEADENGVPDVMIGEGQRKKKHHDPYDPEFNEAKEIYVPTGEEKKKDSDLPEVEQNKKPDNIIFAKEAEDDERRPRSPREAEEFQRKKKVQNQDSLHVRKGGIFNEDSIFVKGVSKTLDESVLKGDGVIQSHLENNTHLACIVVESPRFSGYLVAAMGKDKKMDDAFVETIRIRLMKFLKESGEPIENEDNMQIKIKRVDFEGWALEYAQFLRKSVHKGDEVAMAFFPFAEAQTKVEESAISSMVSIRTDDIKTDVPLEFNLYIYLPSNKKYVLYTPQNGKFLEEQKKRLTKQGVNKLHIKKDDVQNLSKFKAQNHLNSLVDQFEQKKTVVKKKAS